MNENATRGTFGFVPSRDEEFHGRKIRERAVVVHVFTSRKFAGKLLIHYAGNPHFYAVIDRDEFKPSRDAYWSEGSGLEAEWEGDSCRCTNYWATDCTCDGDKPNPNCATNIHTDEKALEIYGPFFGESQIASNLGLSEASATLTNQVNGTFDVHVVHCNGEFAGFKIVPAGRPKRI